ncbi:MAG TPA: Fe-Mn family superoxide dismutase [Nitrospira sp.]|nr:Fe-Mn family superoxide dismutase [Nitrospira sp.]
MKYRKPYPVKSFDLHGLNGISDRTLEMHFKLYEGYVKETNRLSDEIREFLKDGKVNHEEMPAYSELTRRLGFEYNGMVLHELYFANLIKGEAKGPSRGSAFLEAVTENFGNYELWRTGFMSVGNMRGVGWAICSQDPATGSVSNHWVTLHEHGNVAGFIPLLVMDVWEHAYLLDYRPAERNRYIDAFFANINWKAVDARTASAMAHVGV